jgi:DNA-binding CsgD family transcriptional regulator
MVDVIRAGWGRENPAFRQLFTTMLMPEGSTEQARWLNELARICTTPDAAATMERAFYEIDVTELAPRVQAPTLVLHARDDALIPFEEGRLLASLVPNARFVPLESRNHILLEHEPAWARFLAEVDAFLGVVGDEDARAGQPGGEAHEAFPELTPQELTVLELMAGGAGNDTIAEELSLTPKTVRNYVSRIYDKIGTATRAQAIVLAREAGLGKGSRPR